MSEFIAAERSSEQPDRLPVFIYGSLREGKLSVIIGAQALASAVPARMHGLELGMGDRFPCADQTFDFAHTTEGELCSLAAPDYDNSLQLLDEYEGVEEGYYRRSIIFVHQEGDMPNVLRPSWVYTRGELLQKPNG